jgi:hypothetical protein
MSKVREYLPSTDEQHHDHHAVHDGEDLLRRGIVMQKNTHDHRALATFLLLHARTSSKTSRKIRRSLYTLPQSSQLPQIENLLQNIVHGSFSS